MKAYKIFVDGLYIGTEDFTLAEFPKSKDEPRAYHPTYWVRSARDLAVAMYRYKVTGTIYS